MFVTIALTLAAQAATPPQRSTTGEDRRPIIVTGQRLETLQQALQDCIRAGCAPDKEIDAAMAVAEQQFVDGDYQRAQSTIYRSIHRNRRHASTYVQPVADLYRVRARLMTHLGDGDVTRTQQVESHRVLADGFGRASTAALAARLDSGDMQLSIGRNDSAEAVYRSVVKAAVRAGDGAATAAARLRLVSLYAQYDALTPNARYDKRVAELVRDMEGDTSGAGEGYRAAARRVMAAVAERRGDTGAIARAEAAYAAQITAGGKPPARPVLLASSSVDLSRYDTRPVSTTGVFNNTDMDDNGTIRDQWIDVGFWIASDGSIHDVEVLRESERRAGAWPDEVVKGVQARRYSAFAPPAGEDGEYRTERHTMTALTLSHNANQLVRVTGAPRIEVVDLTPERRAPAEPSATRP